MRYIGIDLAAPQAVACVLEGGRPTVVAGAAARWTGTSSESPIPLLTHLAAEAKARLGSADVGAVLAAPAYASIAERRALEVACTQAGFAVARVVSATTAIGVAYTFTQHPESATILTIDLAADAYGLSLVEARRDVVEILAVHGGATADPLSAARAALDRMLAEFDLTPGEIGQVVAAGDGLRFPAAQQWIHELERGRPPYRALPPEQLIAAGAAVRAAALDGAINALVREVLPIDLGVVTAGGQCAELVVRNTAVPVGWTRTFTTTVDQQTSARIRIVESRNAFASVGELGAIVLTGLLPAPAGTTEIEVAVDITADGRITITARDLTTTAAQSMTLPSAPAPPGTGGDEIVAVATTAPPAAAANPAPPPRPIETVGMSEPQQNLAGDQVRPSAPGYQPSQQILAAAQNHRLGRHEATYPHRYFDRLPTGPIIATVIVLAILAIGLARGGPVVLGLIPFMAVVIAGWRWLPTFLESPRHALARFAYLPVRGVGFGSRTAQLSLFEHGLVVAAGSRTTVFRWDTVTVRQDIVQHRYYGRPTRLTYTFMLTDPSGESFRITGRFAQPDAWAKQLRQHVIEAQLPRAYADVSSGAEITFGPLRVTATTLAAHARSVHWSQVEEIRVRSGFLSVRVAGQWLSLAKIAVNAVPNYFVFLALADRLRAQAASR
ncbi:Hsp70 family protein [Nocardia terpenica]|uniref:DUF6585 family protein n=1 Tax=Nocardia terpenica TaxID=455432 RepID=UPI001895194E|nr:DUF6585 family protein [Nocardia terpenica]MBF6061686.1 Hsp70 family protein [Nocardia terpenica]MBF6107519.1 Hsp70 family protein [Nocardia terpenica]MBF6110106.1 Hsp70 family protein [Nocardia terpenica]MBF6122382.1 Hsp70 family protein [Nocardia terpenica]MBF6151442.1 Hsp70 family protein [Nocardia terpenica]